MSHCFGNSNSPAASVEPGNDSRTRVVDLHHCLRMMTMIIRIVMMITMMMTMIIKMVMAISMMRALYISNHCLSRKDIKLDHVEEDHVGAWTSRGHLVAFEKRIISKFSQHISKM